MADELVLRCAPRHDTTKVRADGVDTVGLGFIFTRYREVDSVALEGTNESRHVASKTEQHQNRKIVVSSLSFQSSRLHRKVYYIMILIHKPRISKRQH